MILTASLKLDQYLDIDIESTFDGTDNPVFTCDVSFYVLADSNGLQYEISSIDNPHLEYDGVMYSDTDKEDEELHQSVDLSKFKLEVNFTRNSNENKSVNLDQAEINILKQTLTLNFTH